MAKPTREELQRHGLIGSVASVTSMAGVPPAFPQGAKLRISEDCYEDVVMLSVNEDGDIVLQSADGEVDDLAVYDADDFFV